MANLSGELLCLFEMETFYVEVEEEVYEVVSEMEENLVEFTLE
jgi:hypothetical protein